MARIRSIKPEFWTSEQIIECSTSARLMFIGLWNFCDDHGRHSSNVRRIKAEIFPGDDFSFDDIRRMIDELVTNGLIIEYSIDDQDLIQVTGWHHQKIDRPQKSKYPPPPEGHSSNVRRSFATEGKRKGEEGRGEERAASPSPGTAREIDEKPKGALGIFRTKITDIYLDLGLEPVPDTGRCDVWESQGYNPELCVAVVREILQRTKAVKPLAYFDRPIKEAHEKRRGSGTNGVSDHEHNTALSQGISERKPLPPPDEKAQHHMATAYRDTGCLSWPFRAAQPGKPGCPVDPAILRQHGIDPETGRPLPPSNGSS